MSGQSGICVADSMCYDTQGQINSLQDFLANRVIETYTKVVSYATYFQPVMIDMVNGPTPMCRGPTEISCAGNDTFCLLEPESTDPDAVGECYAGATAFGLCQPSQKDACGSGNKCLVPTDIPNIDGWGWCVPSNFKRCTVGVTKECPKGDCASLAIDSSSSSGACSPPSDCEWPYTALGELVYWQFEDARTTFQISLDATHQAIVRAAINQLTGR